MRPSTSPGASPTHAVVQAERGEERLDALGGERRGAGAARELDQRAPAERRQRVEADRGAAAVERVQRSHRRTAARRGAPCSGGPSGSAPASIEQPRDVARRPRPGRARRSRPAPPARAARWATAARRRSTTSRSSPPPAAPAARGPRRCARRGYVVPAAAGLAAQAPGRDHARAQRRRPPARLAEAELVERLRDLVADVDADEVLQLERAPSESRRRARSRRSSRRRPRAPAASCSASRPKGRLQRLTRKPGPSVASMTRLPIASPGGARDVRAPAARTRCPAMTSTSAMIGAGLKKCMPTTRAGSAAARAIAVIGIDEVFDASTAPGATSRQRGEQLVLELEALGRGLDDEPGRRPASSSSAAPATVAGLALQPALGPPALEAVGDLLQRRARAPSGTGSCSSVRAPACGGELRDPGAHGPGADDADDLGHLAHAEGN